MTGFVSLQAYKNSLKPHTALLYKNIYLLNKNSKNLTDNLNYRICFGSHLYNNFDHYNKCMTGFVFDQNCRQLHTVLPHMNNCLQNKNSNHSSSYSLRCKS